MRTHKTYKTDKNGGDVTRRELLLAATAGAAAILAAACGAARGGGVPAKPTGPLSAQLLWTVWGNTAEVGAYETMAKNYQAKRPTVKIEVLNVAFGEYFTKIQTLSASDSALDLVRTSSLWVPALTERGIYQELNAYAQRDKINTQDYYAAALQTYSWQGKQMVWPDFLNTYMLFYNKDLFARAGLKPPDEMWTMETALDVAKKLTQRPTGGAAEELGIGNPGTSLTALLSWIWNFGGKLYDNDEHARRSVVGSDANTEAAFQWLADLKLKHRVAPSADDERALGSQSNQFYSGKLAILPTGAFSIPDIRTRTSAFAWDVAPLPKGKAGRFAYMGGTGMGVHKKSKILEATWDLLKFVIGPEGQKTIVDVQLGVPPYKPLAKKEFVQLPPPPANRKLIAEAPEVAKLSPKTPRALEIDPIWREGLAAIFNGTKSVKDALRTVEQKVNDILGAR